MTKPFERMQRTLEMTRHADFPAPFPQVLAWLAALTEAAGAVLLVPGFAEWITKRQSIGRPRRCVSW